MPKMFGFEPVPVPGPRVWPLVGAPKRFYEFLDDPIGVVWASREQGDVVGVVGNNPALVCVFGQDLNRRVLSDASTFRHDEDLLRRRDSGAMKVLSEAMVVINGEKHKRHRRLMLPAFQRSALDGYSSDIVEVTRARLETWTTGQADLEHLCRELALCVAMQCFYGLDVSDGVPELGALAVTFVNLLTDPKNILAPIDLPGTTFRRTRLAAEEMVSRLQGLLQEKRALGAGRTDAMALLVAARDEDGGRLSDDELVAEAATLFVAGHETTAMTLVWVLFALDRHPDVLADVLAEIDAVLGERLPTPEDVPKLVLLDRVIRETLRVLAPVPILFMRVLAETTTLGAFTLPKDANVVVSPLATHHDPTLYAEPRRFRPERWETLSPPPYTYLPFGAGPRACIGLSFADRALRLMLPMILRRWRVAVPEGTRVDRHVRANILMVKGGLPVTLAPADRQRRSAAPIEGNLMSLLET
ncbi:MAG: cytochrome P450 [Myxococcales bacterium]|nr:cytochrome P450 [Myxococcales bacterium]